MFSSSAKLLLHKMNPKLQRGLPPLCICPTGLESAVSDTEGHRASQSNPGASLLTFPDTGSGVASRAEMSPSDSPLHSSVLTALVPLFRLL